jgi:hypothetical protein
MPAYSTISPRGEVTYYLHDLGEPNPSIGLFDVSGDQTTQRYYFNTTSSGAVDTGDVPADYVVVHNAKLDIPGFVPGDYIL